MTSQQVFVLQVVIFILIDKSERVVSLDTTKHENSHWDEEWNQCCKSPDSVCHGNSCYFSIARPSAWSQMRSRCRSMYPTVPKAVDLVYIMDNKTVKVIKNVVEKAGAEKTCLTNSCSDFWSSGFRCVQDDTTAESDGLVYGWTAADSVFPMWLRSNPKDLESSKKQKKVGGCHFLVISVDTSDKEKMKYFFQDQRKAYPAICEFTRKPRTETTELQQSTVSTEPATSPIITAAEINTAETKSSTSSSTEEKTSHATESATPRYPTTTDEVTTKDQTPYEITSPEQLTSEDDHEMRTTSGFYGCKEREEKGILWPNTNPGDVVRRRCPEGMKGEAEWTCDRKTLDFYPPTPRIQNCKHEWIVDFEEEVNDEQEDAVQISQRLANKTKSSDLSHGDLTALLNLTEKLMQLFSKQHDDQDAISHDGSPYHHFTMSLVTSYSHVLSSAVEKAWKDLEKESQVREATRIIQQMEWSGHQLSCKVFSKENLQYSLFEENINMQTFSVVRSEHLLPLVFPAGVKGGSKNALTVPAGVMLQRGDSFCRNGRKTALGILYRNLGNFLRNSKNSEEANLVVSPIISFSMSNSTRSIPLGGSLVSIMLERSRDPLGKPIDGSPKCVFWNFEKGKYGQWDVEGCYTDGSNGTHFWCSCNHLTNFAVIMDVSELVSINDDILGPMTLICCTVSIFSLIATCLALLGIREMRCRRSTITCNLSICLIFLNLLVLFGFNQTETKILCAVIAGFGQYFVLSSFCWMLLEGFHLYQMVVLVFHQSSHLPMAYFHGFGYGVPLIIVIISASIRHEDYGSRTVCWLSNENGLMWSVVGPIAVTIVVNFIIFIRTIRSAAAAKIKKEQSAAKNAKSWIKGSLSILCLLGLTWTVGFMYMWKELYFMSYIFTLLNGLQGVFIFIFHVLLNEKVTNALTKGFNKKTRWNIGIHRTATNVVSNGSLHPSRKSLTVSLTSSTKTTDESNGIASNREQITFQHGRNASLYIRNASAERSMPHKARGRLSNGNIHHR